MPSHYISHRNLVKSIYREKSRFSIALEPISNFRLVAVDMQSDNPKINAVVVMQLNPSNQARSTPEHG